MASPKGELVSNALYLMLAFVLLGLASGFFGSGEGSLFGPACAMGTATLALLFARKVFQSRNPGPGR